MLKRERHFENVTLCEIVQQLKSPLLGSLTQIPKLCGTRNGSNDTSEKLIHNIQSAFMNSLYPDYTHRPFRAIYSLPLLNCLQPAIEVGQ